MDGRKHKSNRKKILNQDNLSDRFSEIYRLDYWKSATNTESASGDGSTKERSAQYLGELDIFMKLTANNLGRPVKFFDAPCGDLNWIKEVFTNNYVKYHGADIVSAIISQNRTKNSNKNIEFSIFDITEDTFPKADVWHCRDCFFHLSYRNIIKSLENFTRSEIPFALLTSHMMSNGHRNSDIEDGDFRFLDLTKAPFNFPEPITVLNDGGGNPEDPKRTVGLYARETISLVLETA